MHGKRNGGRDDNSDKIARLVPSLALAAFLIFSSVASMSQSAFAQGNATVQEERPATKTPLQYIANIRQLLSELQTAYNAGNYTQAEGLAAQAYLDNFENVEDPLSQAGKKDLMEQIEQMMRVELREKINDKIPAGDLAAFISAINAKLGEAEQALG